MGMSLKQEMDLLRAEYTEKILEMCGSVFDDVMRVKGDNKFCFPVVGAAGTELFCEITVSIPKGSKDEPYDGYALARDWAFACEEKERKRKEKEEEKKRKKEKDAEIRRKKEEQKNER